MRSANLATLSRGLRMATLRAPPRTSLAMRMYARWASTTVKVPPMAESISEGTLKQWNKQIGDFVEQDEEIATIETDKVRSHRSESSAPREGRLTISCRST